MQVNLKIRMVLQRHVATVERKRRHFVAGHDLRMITLRMRFLADVSVSLHGGAVVVRLGAGGELTVIRIVLTVAHIEIAAKDHITGRGPVPVSVETMASPTAASAPPCMVLATSRVVTASVVAAVVAAAVAAAVVVRAETASVKGSGKPTAAASPPLLLLVGVRRWIRGGGGRRRSGRDEGTRRLALQVRAELLFQRSRGEEWLFSLPGRRIPAKSIIHEFHQLRHSHGIVAELGEPVVC